MSTRALTPVSITRSSLIRSRLVTCSTVASGHAVVRGAGQVRMFCGRGWKYAWYNNHHNRVNRRDVLHDMAKLYRGQYTLVKRMANRRSGKQQFWKEWNNSLKQSHDERGDIWRDSKRQRDYWKDDMSELVKKIESDPYNFLFGKSNEYLQLGKGWSSFCRSFLDPKASPEQKSSTSSAQDRSAKSTTDDVSGKNSVLEKDSKVDTLKSNTCSEAGGFRYDPISGRMKPIEKPAAQVARDEAKDDNQRIDIPVKVFTRSEGTNSDHIVPEQKSLGVSPPTQVNDSKILYTAAPTQDKPVTLENLSKVPTDTFQQSKITQTKQKKILQYNPKEVTEDDVDLLRASDIRAAFFTGETNQELAEKKKKLREAMEKDYTLATNEHVDDLILQSLRQKKDASLVKGTVTTTEILADPLQVHNVLQSEKSEVVDQGDDSNTITKGHVSDTTVATSRLNNSLDETIQRAGRFINDVRLLTGDIQKACERLEASASSPSNTLRILAFDSASSQVVCAETTSSMHASEPIHHTADVLLQLNNPAKFLPYFAKMKADGYEIVSGGSDILIFRKTVGSESVKPAKLNDFTVYGKREPENSTSMPDNDGESSLNKDPSKSKIVRRQETVYTGGPPNWSPYYPPSSSSPHASNAAEGTEAAQTEASTRSSSSSRLGRGLRRIVLSGVATAGTFYAIGVVCEYFLTGGQDGLGPEGFTEFEAERRRRD